MNARAGHRCVAVYTTVSAYRPIKTIIRNLALIGAVVLNTGCATSLGYIPEYPKPDSAGPLTDFGDELTYRDVRKWAMDVMDGYDSRATSNRYASYGGAIVGAAAATSLVGLAAFEGGSGWIKGIPIGGGFLAGLFALYNNDVKAEIYSVGTNHLHRLINNSERRRFWLAQKNKDVIEQRLKEATGESERLEQRLIELKKQRAEDATKAAQEFKAEVDKQHQPKPKADNKKPKTDNKKAKSDNQGPGDATPTTPDTGKDEIVKSLSDEIEEVQQALAASNQRIAALTKLQHESSKIWDLPAPHDCKLPTGQPTDQSGNSSMIDSACDSYEKLCLRDDVQNVMERVDRLNQLLAPTEVANTLKNLSADIGKNGNAWVKTPELGQVKKDLAYLYGPISSNCGVL